MGRAAKHRGKVNARAEQPTAAANEPRTRVAPRIWLLGAALVALVVAVYSPTLQNGFIWDDDQYVEDNPTLRSAEGLRDIWFKLGAVPQYYPLVHTTFWAEFQLWGTTPLGYHVVNMLLHATSALLVWRLLTRLDVPGAWLAAAVFAVHPVEVESVAWITERKNVLSCALALAALLAWLHFDPIDARSTSSPSRKDWRFYALALGLYVLALLSKTVTASLPAVILVVLWWKRGRVTRGDIVRLLPFFGIGLALASITVWMERTHVGAVGEEFDLPAIDRILIAGRALWFYAGKIFWPHPLIFFYPRWTTDSQVWWQYLYPAAALALIVTLWLARNRLGRGPLAAVLIFAGVLTPALGFFNVYPFLYSFVADHFQYHASIALIAAAVAALVQLARRWKLDVGRAALVAAAALLAPLAILAREKTTAYESAITLYQDTVTLNPSAWAAHINLAHRLQRLGQFDQAVEHFRQGLAANPNEASTHIGLGTSLFLSGKGEEGLAEIRRGLEGKLRVGDRAAALVRVGIILNQQKRFDEAIAEFEAALALDPDSSAALMNYGIALEGKGELDAAIDKVRRSLAIYPSSALAQHRLGTLLLATGTPAEAIKPLYAAVRLQPTDPLLHESLAEALMLVGNWELALRHVEQAILLNPNSAVARDLLGNFYLHRGNLTQAIQQFEAAVKLDPQNLRAQADLKKAQALNGGRPPDR